MACPLPAGAPLTQRGKDLYHQVCAMQVRSRELRSAISWLGADLLNSPYLLAFYMTPDKPIRPWWLKISRVVIALPAIMVVAFALLLAPQI